MGVLLHIVQLLKELEEESGPHWLKKYWKHISRVRDTPHPPTPASFNALVHNDPHI